MLQRGCLPVHDGCLVVDMKYRRPSNNNNNSSSSSSKNNNDNNNNMGPCVSARV